MAPATAAPTHPPVDAAGGVQAVTVKVLESVPHDPLAFTQGLVFDSQGRLFESTGLEGRSSLREVDPDTGTVVRSVPLDATLFAEGLALVDDTLIQITWQDGVAFAYDAGTFEQRSTFEYSGEGWGLCYDGSQLVMSNGTDVLTFRDAETFEHIGEIAVRMNGDPLPLLNELECIDGDVYANVYRSDLIAVIEPSSGEVTTVIDAAALPRRTGADVLNGIAVDPQGNLWLTGKLWEAVYRVELVPL